MSQPTHRAFLSLGSNIEPEYHLISAAAMLADYGRVSRSSTVWETTPLGFTRQPPFLNAALLLRTDLDAKRLVEEVIPRIEQSLGRVRDPANPNGPRTIDIDLVLFNHEVVRIGTREIPDPDILTRVFLATTLNELDSAYVHPITRQRMCEIADSLIHNGWTGSMVRRDDVQLR